MRTSRVAGLLFLATAALAQQQQTVEITSEPSHHLVLQNEYVRVFDMTVAPKASTLVHHHGYDYVFVTLGDSDVVSARIGEKLATLKLKDGEVRYTPGNFAHAAINRSDRPFHNITIELLKPSSKVIPCPGTCFDQVLANDRASVIQAYSSDQWTASQITLPPNSKFDSQAAGPTLLIAVTKLELLRQSSDDEVQFKRPSGGLEWIRGGLKETIRNGDSKMAQFVVLEFKPDK
jgi:quercetin dioxygenase-like cupin family protein